MSSAKPLSFDVGGYLNVDINPEEWARVLNDLQFAMRSGYEVVCNDLGMLGMVTQRQATSMQLVRWMTVRGTHNGGEQYILDPSQLCSLNPQPVIGSLRRAMRS